MLHQTFLRGAVTAAVLIGAAFQAQAIPVTFSSTAPTTAVPDPGSLTQSLLASGMGPGSTLASIRITMLHTWVGDLVFQLSHGATTVVLMDRPLGDTLFIPGVTNYYDSSDLNPSYPLTFSAAGLAAADTVGAGCANDRVIGFNTGCRNASFLPEQPLTAFDGMDLNGEWKLTVTDAQSVVRGSLYGWTLAFDAAAPVPEPSTLALLLAAAGAAGLRAWRRAPRKA